MAKGQLSRKKRERNQRKEEILSIALALFSKRGFKNVSMQEIADTAEYAVGTLYNLFGSKDALFQELYEKSSSQMKVAVLNIFEGPETEVKRLFLFFRSIPDLLEAHAEFIKLYVTEMGQVHTRLRHMKNNHIDDMKSVTNTALAGLISKGIKKGVFRSVDPHITAKAIGALIETLAFEIEGEFNKKEITASFKKAEQLFIEGLLVKGEGL